MSDDPVDIATRVVTASVGTILPIRPGTKVPDGKRVRNGHLDATADPVLASKWARTGSYAIRPDASIVVTDIDDHDRFNATVGAITWPETWTIRTPRGGLHLVYEQPPVPLPIGRWPQLGFDLRTHDGYIIGAGTIGYETIVGAPEEIAQLPDEIAAKLRAAIASQDGDREREREDHAHERASGTPRSSRYAELVDELMARTPSKRRRKSGWRARCPGPRHVNGDRDPSLDWDDVVDDQGARKLLLICRSAGCTAAEIVDALGFAARELFDDDEPGFEFDLGDESTDETADELDALFIPAPERVASLSGGQRYLLPWWLPADSVTLMVGKVKEAGKTTLALAMARAVATGSPFMGEPIDAPRPVVILTEMYGSALRVALVRAALDDVANVFTVTFPESRIAKWPQLVERTAKFCRQVSAGLVIVDTVGAFAGIHGESENDAGAMQDALRPLQLLANGGTTVLGIVQARKAGGNATDVVRGSSASAGAADLILAVRRDSKYPDDNRIVESLGRFDETPPFAVIALTDDGYIRIRQDDGLRQKQQALLLEALPILPDTITRQELQSRLHVVDREALDDLVASGRVVRLGRGVVGDGYRYGKKP